MKPLPWLDEQDFYEVMQAYRHASELNQRGVVDAFENVKSFIRSSMAESISITKVQFDLESG